MNHFLTEASSGIQRCKVVVKSVERTMGFGKVVMAVEKPMGFAVEETCLGYNEKSGSLTLYRLCPVVPTLL